MALFESTLALLLGAVILTGVARRVGVPYPSLLAIAGAALAFVPAGPELEIEPDLALALFVAPVLLDAAFDTSPRDLRRNVIPLVSLVVVAVGLTTAVVAWVGWRLGGLPIAAAVALGAIVAPPDAAAAAAVLGRLRLPRRILHVLQGESLLNDATALLVYRIAVGAAVGTVTLGHTGPIVALMAVGSPVAGWLLARLYLLGTARVRDALHGAHVRRDVRRLAARRARRAVADHHHGDLRDGALPGSLAPRDGAQPRQYVFGLGDGRLRAERARVRDHGPAGATHPEPPVAREPLPRTPRERRRASGRDRRPYRVRDGLQHGRAAEEPLGRGRADAGNGAADSRGRPARLLVRHAWARHARDGVRVAVGVPRPGPDRPLRVLRGAGNARHPGLHAPPAARPPRLRDGRRGGAGDLARTSRHHAGGARHPRGRALARGGGRPRRVPRRPRGGREPGGAAGPDRARPATLARDHGPATDVAPAARGGRDRRRGVSPAGGGGRLGRARRRPGRVLPAAHDGRRGAGSSDVTSSYSCSSTWIIDALSSALAALW